LSASSLERIPAGKQPTIRRASGSDPLARSGELGGGVVKEPWERFVDDRQVTSEHERSLGRMGVAPLGDPVEEAVQVDETVLDADAVQRLARAQPVLGGKPGFEVLDVVACEIGAAGDLRVVGSNGCRTRAGRARCATARPKTQRDLVDKRRASGDAWRRRHPRTETGGRVRDRV
jgi:hypothetical protein